VKEKRGGKILGREKKGMPLPDPKSFRKGKRLRVGRGGREEKKKKGSLDISREQGRGSKEGRGEKGDRDFEKKKQSELERRGFFFEREGI